MHATSPPAALPLAAAAIPLMVAVLVPLAVPSSALAERWLRPVPGEVARPFDYAPAAPFARGAHRGADIAARPGTPVRAACGGVVAHAGAVARHGGVVSVRCGARRVSYLPLRNITVRAGQTMSAGTPLGAVASGHGGLHLGVRRDTDRFGYEDPLPLLSDAERPVAPLAVPRRVAPRLVAPRRTVPRLAAPRRVAPRLAAPRLAAPRLAAPRLAAPRLAAQRLAAPRLAAQRRVAPRLAAPRRVAPRLPRRITPHPAPAPVDRAARPLPSLPAPGARPRPAPAPGRISPRFEPAGPARRAAGDIAPWPVWLGLSLVLSGAAGSGTIAVRRRRRVAPHTVPTTLQSTR